MMLNVAKKVLEFRLLVKQCAGTQRSGPSKRFPLRDCRRCQLLGVIQRSNLCPMTTLTLIPTL